MSLLQTHVLAPLRDALLDEGDSRSARLWRAGVVGVATLASVWLVWFAPVLPDMARWASSTGWQAFWGTGQQPGLIGGGIDHIGTLWTFDFVARMLSGQTSAVSMGLFAPFGVDWATLQGAAWMDAIVAYPLVATMGTPDFYNVYILLMLFATQIACYLLFRSMGAPVPLAFALALVVVVNPFMKKELYQGRPTQVHLVFHALFLLFAWRLTGERARWWLDGPLAGVMLGCACLVYWFSGVSVGLLGAVAVLGALALYPKRWKPIVKGGIALAGTAAVTAGAAAWPLVRRVLEGGSAAVMDDQKFYQTFHIGPFDIGGIPANVNVWATGFQDVVDVLYERGLSTALLVAGGLAIVALPAWRRSAPWIVGGALALTMPLGPIISWKGVWVPTAFGMAHWVFPLMARCNFPNRMMVVALLGVCGALAVAAGVLAPRLPAAFGLRRAVPWLVAVVLGVMAVRQPAIDLLGTSNPFPLEAFYTQATQTWPGGIIDAPMEQSNADYVYQLKHHQPLLGGPGVVGPNTKPPGWEDYVYNNSVLMAIEGACRYGQAQSWSRVDLMRLREDGFRLVIVHPQKCAVAPYQVAALMGVSQGLNFGEFAFPLPEP